MKETLKKLNKIGKNYIDDSFCLNSKESFIYTISGNNVSDALNQLNKETQIVKVLNWFDDLWLYIEIKFVFKKREKKAKKSPRIFFILSVFQGHSSDKNKKQLFRAEWDNYEEANNHHPQPHWHIYTNNSNTISDKDFEELIEESSDSFEDFIAKDSEVINIDRFHFAMNGLWAKSETDTHIVESYDELSNWFEGLVNHIKKELVYLKKL